MRVSFRAAGRRPAFELMEPRRLLAADLLVAAGDIGAEPPVMQLPGSISGSVFALGGPEAPNLASGDAISGVQLELLNPAGEVLAEARTDDAGAYEFPELGPGEYAIRQMQPAGYDDDSARVGSGGGVAVTPNYVMEIYVDAGSMLVGYDFIEVIASAPAGKALAIPEAPSAAVPIPSVVVSWPRPIIPVETPVQWMPAAATLPSRPVELRRSEPIFGGSSGVRHDDVSTDPFADVEFVERVARAIRATHEAHDGRPAPLQRRESSARDRAFEMEVEGENDGGEGNVASENAPIVNSAATHGPEPRSRPILRKPAA